MDPRIREIISKQAGVYFVVTKKSQVAEIEATSKMRLFFINVKQSPVNSLVKFAKGDTDGFTSLFGKESRAMVKGGNFSHQVCLDALASGPISVVNLRHFDDDRDITDVGTINPNTILANGIKGTKVPYTSLFDTSSFWIPKTDKISEHYTTSGFLNFANIGSNDFSLIVVKSTPEEVSLLTAEGNKTLENTSLEIDDLPGLNFSMLLKDTFVTVYLFSKVLSQNNPSYAHLFENGKIKYGDIQKLIAIPESGYFTKYTGSVIPNLISEKQTELSIDRITYSDYMQSGLLIDINQDLLESSLDDLSKKNGMIDLYGFDSDLNSTTLLSYNVPSVEINATAIKFIPDIPEENVEPFINITQTGVKYATERVSLTSFKGTSTQGLKIGDLIIGENGLTTIESMTKIDTQTKNGTTVMNYNYVGFAYGNGKYIGVSNNTDLSLRNFKWVQSTDKENWTSLNMNISDLGITSTTLFTHVLYGSSFAVFGFDSVNNKNYMLRNDSGVWKCIEINSSEQIKKVVYGAGRYIALSDTKIFVIKNTSVDIYDNLESLIDLCYYNYSTGGNFFGLSVNKVIKSSNGEQGTWTLLKTNDDANVRYKKISYTTTEIGIFVQTIADSKFKSVLKSSNNGTTWSEVVLTTPINTIKSLINNGVIYVLSDDDSLLTSDLTAATTAVDLSEYSYNGINVNVCGSEIVISSNDEETEAITFIGHGTVSFLMTEIFTLNIDIYEIKCNGEVKFTEVEGATHITKIIPFVYNAVTYCNVYTFESYTPVEDQFTNGTSSRQKEILDMMNNPGIIKGIASTKGLRYVIDCFKSFVEPSYKYQFGLLTQSLDSKNVFVNAIINEPFISDLIKSTNPLMKDTPKGPLNLEYLPEGGNKNYSQILLNKFTEGASNCYFFGPENIIRNNPNSLNGRISNLFIGKAFPFDILANSTGYISVDELGYKFDDDERKFLENFNYNPIIDLDGTTIFGNRDGAGGQIHQTELLSYIKSSLYNMAKKESFTKGTYDDYNRTETEITDFMDSLALANAIKANPVVQCNLENNTEEISKNKIKLIHIEYTPIDGLEKVVFDLNVN